MGQFPLGSLDRSFVIVAAIVVSLLAGGCSRFSNSTRGIEQGYTIILPGCLGHGPWDDQVATRLAEVQVPTAVEIHDWTRGPHMLLVNVFDKNRKEREVGRIVQKIVDYQKRYPGRPVYLIGHSGGGTMVVKTLEAVPETNRVTGAVLLAPGLSRGYDLRVAQNHTERGIYNFYSPLDLLVGGAFMSTVGTHDGDHLGSAALMGFEAPEILTPAERERYGRSLTQHCYSPKMLADGHKGGHFGWTSPEFVNRYLVPIIAPADAAPAEIQQVSATSD